MGVGRARLTRGAASAFWTLVAIRAAFWAGVAVTLLWERSRAHVPTFRAYEARTDLLFSTFAEWDSAWYIHIAERGYDSVQAAAFFPLYPLLVDGLDTITRSTVVAGVLVSLGAAGIAAVLLRELARPYLRDDAAGDAVLYLALYPFAFVFTAVYSEGLFLALAVGAFLAATRNRPWLAALCGALAVATRPVGLALLPALVLLLVAGQPRSPRLALRLAPLALVPVPIAIFALHLDRRLGNARAFVDAQSAHWDRHTPMLGPLGGLWEAASTAWHGAARVLLHLPRGSRVEYPDSLGTLNVAHFAVLVAMLWLTWVAWRRLGAAYGVYSLGTIAIVLSSTVALWPLQSLPRFALADFPLFLALAALTEERPRAREIVLCAFAAVGAALAVTFARGGVFIG